MTRLIPLALLTSCVHSVRPLYDAALDAALVDPGPPMEDWEPDAVLQLSAPLIEDVLRTAVRQQGPLSQAIELGPARAVPELRLKSLAAVTTRPCEGGCIGLDAVFEGTLRWTAGPLHGTEPVSVRGAVDAVFDVVEEKGGMAVNVSPRRLRDLEVEVGGLEATLKGIKRSVRTMLETEALARVPPQTIARFPKSDLPVRAARVLPESVRAGGRREGAALRIELLTDVPQPVQVATGAGPDEGFMITFAEETLLQLARAEAFRHGPVAYGVVPEPTSLSFGPDDFVLGLRLWRIEGRTWWRDYTVTGTARVEDGKLSLSPKEVSEGEKSKGAALADPLAALAEGFILRAIEDAVQTSLPLRTQQKMGAARVVVSLRRLEPGEGSLRATGTVRIEP